MSIRNILGGTSAGLTSEKREIRLLRSRIAELEAELEEERISPLTRLPARRYFGKLAAEAYPSAGAVLLADVDGLKTMNDQHGHRAGDELIAEIGSRLKAVAGEGSVVGHLSGDEFAAVLAIKPLKRTLDQMHEQLTRPFSLVTGLTVTPGISLGLIAGSQLEEASLSEAMHGADLAMYAAKRCGGGWRLYDATKHGPLEVDPAPVHRGRHRVCSG